MKKSISIGLFACLLVLSGIAVYQGKITKIKPVQSVKVETTVEKTTEESVIEKIPVSVEETKKVVSNKIETPKLKFTKSTKISWPVEGKLVMDYSMDTTIYHPTLNEYKCSKGIAIQSEEGTHVKCPTRGVVTKVGKDEEIGNYVVLNLGNNYRMKIGQLDKITVKKGDTVEENDPIGCTAKPLILLYGRRM
ncbi:hypothetical protein P261_00756 [Lachnospiraceae bacterium TWA4]|nr:hypothetical protein P261_00756 [Lachnospiraceae bacterium TWA4]